MQAVKDVTVIKKDLITEDNWMPVEKVVSQVKLIQDIMSSVMKKDEHYGIIPGCKKPSLYQPGADKLMLTFRFDPEPEILSSTENDTLIAFTIKVTLKSITTGAVIASGIGSCNSKEKKYRYMWIKTNKLPSNEEAEFRKSKGIGRWKMDYYGKWSWEERADNDNPWDFHNTILKMATKRAKIAAVLNATAASDIFTQDVEDLPQFENPQKEPDKTPSPQGEKKETKFTSNIYGQFLTKIKANLLSVKILRELDLALDKNIIIDKQGKELLLNFSIEDTAELRKKINNALAVIPEYPMASFDDFISWVKDELNHSGRFAGEKILAALELGTFDNQKIKFTFEQYEIIAKEIDICCSKEALTIRQKLALEKKGEKNGK